jgi:hypothetical protein
LQATGQGGQIASRGDCQSITFGYFAHAVARRFDKAPERRTRGQRATAFPYAMQVHGAVALPTLPARLQPITALFNLSKINAHARSSQKNKVHFRERSGS